MATARTVMNALVQQMVTVTNGIMVGGFAAPVIVGVGWPPTNRLQDIAKGKTSLCSVFDRGASVNTTRWHRIAAIPDINVVAGVSANLVGGSPLGMVPAVLTLGGTPVANDCVVFALGNIGLASVGSSTANGHVGYTFVGGDTLTSFATALVAQINTLPGISASLGTVTSTAPITITNSGASAYATAAAGNIGSRTSEFNRLMRHLAITFWCPSEVYRQAITDPAESFLARSRNTYGFQLGNGEWVRLMYERDVYIEDQQLQSVYRRDFFLECEYGITGTDTVWPVLGEGFTMTVSVPTQ